MTAFVCLVIYPAPPNHSASSLVRKADINTHKALAGFYLGYMASLVQWHAPQSAL